MEKPTRTISLGLLLAAATLPVAVLAVLGLKWGGWPGLVAGVLSSAAAAWWIGGRVGRCLTTLPDGVDAMRHESRIGEIRALVRAWDETVRRLDRVSAAQRDFTANAAHQLRTPLAALRVAGEAALRSPRVDAEGLRDAVGAMLEEAGRTSELVDQLLTLARAESGRLPVETTRERIESLVQPVLDWLQPLAEERKQKLEWQPGGDWSVWVDATLFRLALENLVGNALRYSPPGSAVVVRTQVLAGGGISVDVIDEGPGVAPDEVDRLFERFYRGRDGESPGSGLGLPLARWAVEAFGGRLTAESRLGCGCVFRIFCPEGESGLKAPPRRGPVPEVAEEWAARATPAQVLSHLHSGREGIADGEAERRRAECGRNELRGEGAPSWPVLAWRSLITPFNGVLLAATVLSILLKEPGPATILSMMVLLGSGLRLWQERRARIAIENLERSVELHARVIRPGWASSREIPVTDLVPGDMVHLEAGDMVPADMRLVAARDLSVLENTLNGEGRTEMKWAVTSGSGDHSKANLCFSGTHVATGSGAGVVIATGVRTRLAKAAASRPAARPPSEFEMGVRRVSWLLLGSMAALLPLVFVLYGVLEGDWTTGAFVFGLAVAVGLTPELLPMIVNVNLARGASLLARRGIIAKSLPSVHALGAMDVICLDPARLRAGRSLIGELERAGVACKILTDRDRVEAESAAMEAGWTNPACLSGSDLENLADEEIVEAVRRADVFSSLGPRDKERVVSALRQAGHRVGFFGETATDANALRAADVGFALDTAADLARGCAGVILTANGWTGLPEGVREGRQAFGNILKYIKITASSNLGNALSVALAAFFLPFRPILAIQLLLQNLLYDLTQFVLPWDRVDRDFLERPRAWSALSIGRFMLLFGPLSCAFDLATFTVLWFFFAADSVENAALFHTGWFTVGLLTQLMIVHVLRTGRTAFFKTPATRSVLVAGGIAATLGLLLPYTPAAPALGLTPMPWAFFVWTGVVLASYAAAATWVKSRTIRSTGQWL
jgi:magnesium-transporting ATPase (P-type)/signal transduction histidine kinase